ncbi:MAG: hypothetical protein JO270_25985 [Acidobacteriaceae bacterium]|nr:hypothetical protein [Acidobacteriaceae bacterium]MBV8572720.1 hypothetical protein [Acidobacteriaceae bacterium]
MNESTRPSWGLALCTALAAMMLCSQSLPAQIYRYSPEHARPVDATIHDLKMIAAHNTYSGHEMQRYDSAMTHLSQFAERLHQGVFDKGKLDRSIDDVQNVLNKNPLDGRARNILNRDVLELRRLRRTWDLNYRYGY